eukprot:scaffold130487_cov75-Phaeocystis_antarctica.AAC.1
MLLSLSDDELQLVHEAVPGDTLWSCMRCCKRLRTAAMASGGLALVAAVAGDLESVKTSGRICTPVQFHVWRALAGCAILRQHELDFSQG